MQFDLFDLQQFQETICDTQSNDNCRFGLISEMQFVLKAIELGYSVFTPYGHAQKVDLVLHKPQSKAITIQIKKATPIAGDKWKISTSCKKRTSKGTFYTNYQRGDFDYLVAHIAELNLWSIYRIEEVSGKSSVGWDRFGSRRNNYEILEQSFD